MKKKSKRTLTPKLRFPEFRDKPGWEEKTGDSLFDQINDRNPAPGLPVLAITQEHGAIPRDMIDYHVSVTKKSIKSYKVVHVDDFIISLRSFQGGIEYSQYHGICSPAYVILRRRTEGSDAYFKHYLKTDRFIRVLTRNLEGLRDGKMISYKQFSELLLPVPTPQEQQKIADCLSSLDGLIAAEGRKLEALKAHKKGLMQQIFPQPGQTQPRLRFPEFRDKGEWETTTVGKSVKTITPPKRLLTSEYGGEGRFPIIDQSPSPECGRTDDADAILTKGLPFTIFGDHTCVVKFVDQPFAQGADGIKILKARSTIDDLFLYFSLQARPLSSTQYRRHFKTLKEQELVYPNVKTGEQKQITACLSALDAQITAQAAKIEALKQHKRGLMQQLFPSPEVS